MRSNKPQRLVRQPARGFSRVRGVVNRTADDRIEIAAGGHGKRGANRPSERADAGDEQRRPLDLLHQPACMMRNLRGGVARYDEVIDADLNSLVKNLVLRIIQPIATAT